MRPEEASLTQFYFEEACTWCKQIMVKAYIQTGQDADSGKMYVGYPGPHCPILRDGS